jgi:hypothetical protein
LYLVAGSVFFAISGVHFEKKNLIEEKNRLIFVNEIFFIFAPTKKESTYMGTRHEIERFFWFLLFFQN